MLFGGGQNKTGWLAGGWTLGWARLGHGFMGNVRFGFSRIRHRVFITSGAGGQLVRASQMGSEESQRKPRRTESTGITEVSWENTWYRHHCGWTTSVVGCASMIPSPFPPQNGPSKLIHGELSEKIIAAAIEVHRSLGPGLMESVYEACFCRELEIRKIAFQRQLPIDIDYKGLTIECALRPDLIVEDKIVVELKSAEQNHPVFEAQLLSYLKLANKKVGLLINFGLPVLKAGIIRRVL